MYRTGTIVGGPRVTFQKNVLLQLLTRVPVSIYLFIFSYSQDEIVEKINSFRITLLGKQKTGTEYDEYGRPM